MAVFNEAPTVAEAIDRVLDVDLGDTRLELVIVEGNSSDDTRQIVDGYSDDPRVRIIHEEEPRGKGRAVRTGLAAATGDVVLIQDGDLEYRVEDYPALLAPIAAGEGVQRVAALRLAHHRWRAAGVPCSCMCVRARVCVCVHGGAAMRRARWRK